MLQSHAYLGQGSDERLRLVRSKRNELVAAVEGGLRQRNADLWEADADGDAGTLNTILVETVRTVTAPLLDKSPWEDDAGAIRLCEEHRRLLLHRRDLHQRMQHFAQPFDWEAYEDLNWQLARSSRMLKLAKEAHLAQSDAENVERLKTNWWNRHMYMVWKMVRALSWSGMGSRRRNHWAASASAGMDPWAERLQLPKPGLSGLSKAHRQQKGQALRPPCLTQWDAAVRKWMCSPTALPLWCSRSQWSLPNEMWRPPGSPQCVG